MMKQKNVNATVLPELIAELSKHPNKLALFINQACFRMNKSTDRNKPQELLVIKRTRCKLFDAADYAKRVFVPGKKSPVEDLDKPKQLAKICYPGEIIFIKDVHAKLQLISYKNAMLVGDFVEFISLNVDEDFSEAKLRALAEHFDAYSFDENLRLDRRENSIKQEFNPLDYQLSQVSKQREKIKSGDKK